MNQLIHSCHLRIGTGRFQCLRINIISLNICIYIQVHTVLRFLQCIIPVFARNQMFPVFRKKRTVHARSHICRNHSCLDRESTTSAEWIHKNAVFIPWRQHDQCRGQRLSDRSFDSHLTIASLMKRNSGCINPDRSHILHKGYSNREACTILLKPGNSINTFQAFYDWTEYQKD